MKSADQAASRMASRNDRAVAVWLLVCCAMVFFMVVLGGATRLTESGLSMVRWRPVSGILPPISAAEWHELFRHYQQSPEFRAVNFWMTVDDFKAIYWLEYAHRLWGRLIGVVFLLPYLWFWLRRRLRPGLAPKLALMFALGAAQGLLGWYMVKSGLIDRPEVSQYRLAAHLVLAFAIYGYMLWVALALLAPARCAGPRRLAIAVLAWVSLTVAAGAFVAGLDAGHAYNSFPLMDGRLAPDGLFLLSPWPVNFFENAATVQFTHRVLAEALLVLVLWLWLRGLRAGVAGPARRVLHGLAATAMFQVGLGIATLLSEVQIGVAVLHQAGALALFSLALCLVYALGSRRNSTAPAR